MLSPIAKAIKVEIRNNFILPKLLIEKMKVSFFKKSFETKNSTFYCLNKCFLMFFIEIFSFT